MPVATAIKNLELKAAAFLWVATALTQMEWSKQTQQIWCNVFATARLVGRDYVFNILQHFAPVLASFDQGKTLEQLYKVVLEVDGWWSKS